MNKIMFMGTPEISATCLEKLLQDGHGITAVITREDKPRGRGNVMTPTPAHPCESVGDRTRHSRLYA